MPAATTATTNATTDATTHACQLLLLLPPPLLLPQEHMHASTRGDSRALLVPAVAIARLALALACVRLLTRLLTVESL